MTPVALKSRRRLLVLLARLGGCCIATGEVLAAITTDAVNGQELFYGVDVETKHLDKIVEGYLEAYGRVQFPLDLEREVFGDDWLQEDMEVIWSRVRGKVERDFETSRVLVIDGWLLSVVEVQVFFLLHVLMNKQSV